MNGTPEEVASCMRKGGNANWEYGVDTVHGSDPDGSDWSARVMSMKDAEMLGQTPLMIACKKNRVFELNC
jgi:hypothetical protein